MLESAPNPSSALIENALEKIRALPQAHVIKPADARRWVEAVLAIDPQRLDWHIRRLGGIGGSEIGALVNEFVHNERDPWDNARDIVRRKLCLLPPDPPNPDTLRGTLFEPVAQAMFHARFGAVSDQEGLRRMAALQPGERGSPVWMRGNPDDLVLIGDTRVLPDYKIPTDADGEAVMFRYAAQTHFYTLRAYAAGVKVHAQVIAALELAGGTEMAGLGDSTRCAQEMVDMLCRVAREVATEDRPGFRIIAKEIEPSEELFQAVVEVGDHVWNDYVLCGVLPPVFRRPAVDMDAGLRAQFNATARLFAAANALKKEAEERAGTLNKELRELVEGVELDKRASPSDYTTVSVRKGFDLEAAAQRLRDLGHPDSDFCSLVPDPDAMERRLAEELGEDLAPYRKPGAPDEARVRELLGDDAAQYESAAPSIQVTRRKKGDAAVEVAALREEARRLVAELTAPPPEPEPVPVGPSLAERLGVSANTDEFDDDPAPLGPTTPDAPTELATPAPPAARCAAGAAANGRPQRARSPGM